jgi:hypothetical protein
LDLIWHITHLIDGKESHILRALSISFRSREIQLRLLERIIASIGPDLPFLDRLELIIDVQASKIEEDIFLQLCHQLETVQARRLPLATLRENWGNSVTPYSGQQNRGIGIITNSSIARPTTDSV